MNDIATVPSPPPHVRFTYAIGSALQGLVRVPDCWRSGIFDDIRHIGRYVEGSRSLGPAEQEVHLSPGRNTAEILDSWKPDPDGRKVRLPGAGTWTEAIGRPGALALRAASPATRPERRDMVLDFLEMWAGTPFADPAYRFRVGRLDGTTSFNARDHQGVSFGLYLPAARRNLYFEAVLPGGEAAPRPEEPLDVVDRHHRWGTPGQLLRLVELVRERGPVAWDPDAVLTLSEATGMSRPAAALVLAGNPGTGSYHGNSFLDQHERAVLGFKSGELESAQAELSWILSIEGRLDLLADVMPEDPADLWEPGGVARLAERTAAVWAQQHGVRPAPPWSTWQAALALEAEVPAARLCHLFLDPTDSALPPDSHPQVRSGRPEPLRPYTPWEFMGKYGAHTVANAVFAGLTWAYTDLPAGDPVREGMPEAARHLREVLARDDAQAGLLHPNLIHGRSGNERWAWLTGSACDRITARVAVGDLPPGRYESDPRACVPDLVADVATTLDLSEDAAALYLQLLLLPVPSDRNVRRWNAWSPARHKAAATELVARGLVVEDRRARAGRKHFLPGPWAHAKKPLPPMETWKAPLIGAKVHTYGKNEVYAFDLLPGTLPELFTEAWRLVREAQGPAA
ncbi:hypothetical protein CW362_09600 [Streptomyces populi]|uniref:Uncharacterized protein n=1 Tax=Streptomyces populi TaxID=2058924 RepID=A0A2I0STD5_9ACTN|nr:hypothetical protein [Streptomyces populi]PKT73188.1 hypothetical protein CW362_09600 [Streptomyces populi]